MRISQFKLANRQEWLWAFLLIAAAAMVYLPALTGGFVWDDEVSLTENPLIKSPHGLFDIWFSRKPFDYFPLTLSSFWFEWRMFGLHAFGYHAVNLALHITSALILWRLLHFLRIPGAYVVAFLFAVHPLTVASAGWIAERKNTLAMPFFLLSALWYLRSSREESASRQRRLYVASLCCFLMALLSKTSVVTLPLILLVLEWWQDGRSVEPENPTRKTTVVARLTRTAPFFCLSIALGLLTIWFQWHRAMGGVVVQTENIWERCAAAGWAVWFYLFKSIVPLGLTLLYPRHDFTGGSFVIYFPVLLLVALLALLWKKRASWGRHWFAALSYFILALLPVLGLVDMYFLTYSRVADHWSYLALPGIITLVVAVGRGAIQKVVDWMRDIYVNMFSQQNFGYFAALCAVGVCSVLAWDRAAAFGSEESVWKDVLKKNPQCWAAHNNLARDYLNRGINPQETEIHFREALRLRSDFPEAYNNLGMLFVREGDLDLGIAYYRKALALERNYVLAHNNLGVALMKKGDLDDAGSHLRTAIQLDPDMPAGYRNMAQYYLAKTDYDNAFKEIQKVLSYNPTDATACFFAGNCLYLQHKLKEAVTWYHKALQLNPTNVDGQYNMAVVLAESGDLAKARFYYAEALRVDPDYARTVVERGKSLVNNNDLKEALDLFRRASALDPSNADYRVGTGYVLSKMGKKNEAEREFDDVTVLNKQDPVALNKLGSVFLLLDEPARALPVLQQAISLDDGSADCWVKLGTALLMLNQDAEAKKCFEKALALNPDHAGAHYRLGNVLLKHHQLDLAKLQYEAAIKINPSSADPHFQTARLLQMANDYRAAIQELTVTIQLRPDWTEALNNLAWVLATNPDASLRNGIEALRYATRAINSAKTKDADQYDTLAAAYAEAGQFKQAETAAEESIKLAKVAQRTDLVESVAKRLALYQAGKPYRE